MFGTVIVKFGEVVEYKFGEARPQPVFTLGLLLAHGQSPHTGNTL